MSNPQTSPNFKTSIGGQALMEGIMMRGPQKICCAVRKPDGTIDLSYDTVTTHWYNRVPLVRGVCNMAENLYKGYHYLMHAADLALQDDEEPQSRADRWLENHPGVQNVMMALSAFAGVALALFLFTFLPTFLTGLLPLGRWPRVVLEGVLKMGIFLLYMYLCTRMKELHRVFEYHGAEHKTIACYVRVCGRGAGAVPVYLSAHLSDRASAAGSLAARRAGGCAENGHLPFIYVPLHAHEGAAPRV